VSAAMENTHSQRIRPAMFASIPQWLELLRFALRVAAARDNLPSRFR
jgi:hypothetical protein